MVIKFSRIKEIIFSSKIIIFGFFFCILFWIVEAALHTSFFEIEDNFIQHLFTTTFHELWMRSITSFFLILFSVVIYIDQRHRKKLSAKIEEKNKFIHIIFDGIQDGISILDLDLNIIQVNHWMEKMYEFSKPLLGQKCFKVYQKRNSPCPWCPCVKTIKTSEMHTEVVPYPSEHDVRGWIYVSAFPLFDENNNVSSVIEYIQDITELKKVEKKYKDAFSRAEFYKDLFAHDINNILQNILSSSELCKYYSNKINSEEKSRELLETIENQVKRGTTLVSNVRKLSKIEETEIKTQQTNVNKVLKKVIDSLKNSYPSKKMDIKIEAQGNKQYVLANELLFDVFENILNNAVKYNENLMVEIIIKKSETHKNGENYLKIEFIDNGMGIEDVRKELIFKRAYMEGKSVSGMGLGLSLVKRIIDSYNGYIWVEDRVIGDYKKGSNFVILIPDEEPIFMIQEII